MAEVRYDLMPVWMDNYEPITSSTQDITFKIFNEDKSETYFEGKSIGTLDGGVYYHLINYPRICENYLDSNPIDINCLRTAPISTPPNYYYSTTPNNDVFKAFVIEAYSDGSTIYSEEKILYYNYNSFKQNDIGYVEAIEQSPGYTGYCIPISSFHSEVPGSFSFTSQFILDNGELKFVNHVTRLSLSASNPDCVRYMLYFTAKDGTWNSFPIAGKVIEKDKFDTKTYKKSLLYPNALHNVNSSWFHEQVQPASLTKYSNKVTKSFEMHTGWLTDEEAFRVSSYLFSCTSLYVHDLDFAGDGLAYPRIYPGVITNTEVEYKTFKNEKTLISYQIDIDVAYEEQIR